MPRDILSDSLAVLRIVELEDEENWPLEEKVSCKQTNRKTSAPTKQQNHTKDDCACYYNYGLGDAAPNNRQCDPVYQYKTSSLPAAASVHQPWEDEGAVRSALRVAPDDIAGQLSLLDLPCFKAIGRDELTSCGWTRADKMTVAPNVVAFTKRFNRVSFWTVQEILNGQTAKARAEIIVHFIKVAKKLHELNNLHSLFAVVSALNSSSIYRLTKTWACVPKKERQQFDKMAELFSEKDNWSTLREYLRTISLPCIPHLGIFLTDLVYIDMAHSGGAGAGSPHRAAKMAAVLDALERYRASVYDVPPSPRVAAYLNSVRYIEELQRFLEDDQFKLSLKLEPDSPVASCAGSRESVRDGAGAAGVAGCAGGLPGGCAGGLSSPLPRAHATGSLRLHAGAAQHKFVPAHRKCRSLGSNIFGKGHAESKEEKTPAGSVNLLDDTLLESPGAPPANVMAASLPRAELSSCSVLECEYEGCARRKTVLKDGRKVSLSPWQRYWLQLSGDLLLFYASKTFKGCDRCDFRGERCKAVSLRAGWRAARATADAPDTFQLADRHRLTVYKFKVSSEAAAKQWVEKINQVTEGIVKPLPANLMSFE